MDQSGTPKRVGIQSDRGGKITITGSTLHVAGLDLTFEAVQSPQEFLQQLERLKETIVSAGEIHILSEETAIDTEAAVRKAIGQAKNPTPDKKSLLEYLSTAKSLVKGIEGADGLVANLASAIEAVQKLFS
jgi:hypothetical protein